jgi:PAS domain S-box-containing protein
MANRGAGAFGDLDVGVLGKTMLDAAQAAGIGVTVAYVDGTAPRHVYVNEAVASMMGWSCDELLERNPIELIAARDRGGVRERFERRTRGDQGQASYEVVVTRKDGRETPIEVTTSYTVIEGRPAVFAFFVDVSARRTAEQQRLHAEARFRELIESAPEPIGIIREGHFVYVNRAYVETLGFPDAQSLYAVPIASLLDEEQGAIRDARESITIQHGVRQPPQIYRTKRRDGVTILLEVVSVYLEYEGKPAVLGMARDVTMRKQLERQLVQADRLAALGTMAAGVAHEVNNPIAYVMLNLEWIARKLPDLGKDPASLEGLMAMLQEARQGAERVSAIVRELRSFSRADGETRRAVDLEEAVQSAIRLVGHEIRHRAHVTTSFEPARSVWANQARVEQVVINLLLNAAQAMPERGGAQNEIRITVRPEGERHAVLEIFDNGEGIPPDVLPRVFDPFFSTKPTGVGTGLGLSICHGIVASLGGTIAAYSEPGEGTTFRVVLPTTDTVIDDGAPPGSEAPSSRNPKRARVLVVDDELPIANTLRELLAPDHEVVAATNAREALTAIARSDFDVVLCDLIMPGMNGIELYERLRADRPGLERRIVFMTGGAFTASAAEFLASVDNRRIEKPFSLGLVEQIVRQLAASTDAR